MNATNQAASCAYRLGVLYTQLQVEELEPEFRKLRNISPKGYRGPGAKAVQWVIKQYKGKSELVVSDAWKRYQATVKKFTGIPSPPLPLKVSKGAFEKAFRRYKNEIQRTLG